MNEFRQTYLYGFETPWQRNSPSVADPKQKFLIRFWIRIRPKVSDPCGSGSGSATLTSPIRNVRIRIRVADLHHFHADQDLVFQLNRDPDPATLQNDGKLRLVSFRPFLTLLRIRVQLFPVTLIPIQIPKIMQIHSDQDPQPWSGFTHNFFSLPTSIGHLCDFARVERCAMTWSARSVPPLKKRNHCFAVLRIRDVYPGSQFHPYRIPDPKIETKERSERKLLSYLFM
jgi:hypothetical protein